MTLPAMLTARQRQICALRTRHDRLVMLMLSLGSAAMGFAFVGLLTPLEPGPFLTLAMFDAAVTTVLWIRAASLRRQMNELMFFS